MPARCDYPHERESEPLRRYGDFTGAALAASTAVVITHVPPERRRSVPAPAQTPQRRRRSAARAEGLERGGGTVVRPRRPRNCWQELPSKPSDWPDALLPSVELAIENGLATPTDVATLAAVDRIRPAASVEEVVSRASLDMVVSAEAVDLIWRAVSNQRVGAFTAVDVFDAR